LAGNERDEPVLTNSKRKVVLDVDLDYFAPPEIAHESENTEKEINEIESDLLDSAMKEEISDGEFEIGKDLSVEEDMNTLRDSVRRNIMEAYRRIAHMQFLEYVKNSDIAPIISELFKYADNAVRFFYHFC
jgi:uncharacterized protein with PhoU and TrkA domain